MGQINNLSRGGAGVGGGRDNRLFLSHYTLDKKESKQPFFFFFCLGLGGRLLFSFLLKV